MDKAHLVSKNGNSAIVKNSTETLEATLAHGLDLSAAMFSKELTDEEIDFWKRDLARFKPEHVKRAFEDHCSNEDFFPTPNQIKQLIREYIADEAPSPAEKVRAQLAAIPKSSE